MKSILTAVFICAAMPAHAERLACKMEGADVGRNYIAPDIYFDVSGDKVNIGDGVIQYFSKKDWLAGTLAENKADRMVIRWKLDILSASNQRARMEYRATYRKDSKKIRVTVRPTGYTNEFYGTGNCVSN